MTVPPAPGAPGAQRVLFVRRGQFSHTNARLLDALRTVLPEAAIDEVDVEAILRADLAAVAVGAAAAVATYGLSTLRSRALLRHRIARTRRRYDEARRAVQAWVGGRRYDWSLQTQSMFDASSPGRPHFVYTDHAARARMLSAWNDGLGQPSAEWLECEAGVYRAASHVFTFGSGVRQCLVDDYGLAPGKVTRVGAGASVLPSSEPPRALARYARRNILFVGMDWVRKGGPDLLQAFRLLVARLPDATLTIVGCRPPEAEGVKGVMVLGKLPPGAVEPHYQQASCFCMPSRLEPFGVVFVEAAHFVLPVVATTVGDIGDVVRDGENGWRVPPGDPEALAEALWRVLADPATAQRMGAAGALLAPECTWEAVARRIAAVASAASGGAAARPGP
jgi:glycosyltransferase involved in cell wall biosynthesis